MYGRAKKTVMPLSPNPYTDKAKMIILEREVRKQVRGRMRSIHIVEDYEKRSENHHHLKLDWLS